jgi:hypothetical protein
MIQFLLEMNIITEKLNCKLKFTRIKIFSIFKFLSSCALCMSPFHSGSRITQSHDKEYHYECFRCEKCSQPINGTYTMSPDGLRFKVSFYLKKK